jgi:thiamine biosynthesis lipoprotein
MFRVALRRLSLALLLAVLGACAKPPIVEQESYVFGTLVQVKVWGVDTALAHEAIGKVLREFDRLHRALHAWQPSELTILNAALAKGEKAKVSPELAAMVRDAAKQSAQSDALFNPAIGKLVALWGFHNDEYKPALPEAAKVDALVKAKPQMSDLVIEGDTVRSTNRDVQLDFGGYAKGYALDRAAEILRKEGIVNALVNIGGNIIALGEHGNRPWKIGVQHPRKPSAIFSVDLYSGEAIGTSGDYQRYFEAGGKRYCHLIDPRSGWPVQGIQSVTVIAAAGPGAGVLSDVASKPLFIAGVKDWRAAARKMGTEAAMLIDAQGEVYVTKPLAKRGEFLDKKLRIHEVD